MIIAGYHHLLVESWYITSSSIWRSCDGKFSYLYCFLKSLQSIPSCILDAFGMGMSHLADLLDNICMDDHKVFDNGVL